MLNNHTAKRRCQQLLQHRLFITWKHSQHPFDGTDTIAGMHGCKNQMAGFSGHHGGSDGIQVPQLTDQNHIGVLPYGIDQCLSEISSVDANLPLANQ